MLETTGRVEIVGRATDPTEGLAQVAASPIDVLFLDIHMPGLSGFQVVERVPPGPAVVFTTAHDEHAVRAFEVNAVDYLLKPVERARLTACSSFPPRTSRTCSPRTARPMRSRRARSTCWT